MYNLVKTGKSEVGGCPEPYEILPKQTKTKQDKQNKRKRKQTRNISKVGLGLGAWAYYTQKRMNLEQVSCPF